MKKMKIGDFVLLIPGINQTRSEKEFINPDIKYYDQASFNIDFYNRKDDIKKDVIKSFNHQSFVNEGDIVISNSLSLATLASSCNNGKVLSLNFTKVEFSGNELDKLYFLYLYNAYREVKIQKRRILQGSGAIMKIPIRSLEQIIIPVVSLEEQKRIGEIYMETLKLQSMLNKQSELIGRFTDLVLSDKLKESK